MPATARPSCYSLADCWGRWLYYNLHSGSVLPVSHFITRKSSSSYHFNEIIIIWMDLFCLISYLNILHIKCAHIGKIALADIWFKCSVFMWLIINIETERKSEIYVLRRKYFESPKLWDPAGDMSSGRKLPKHGKFACQLNVRQM